MPYGTWPCMTRIVSAGGIPRLIALHRRRRARSGCWAFQTSCAARTMPRAGQHAGYEGPFVAHCADVCVCLCVAGSARMRRMACDFVRIQLVTRNPETCGTAAPVALDGNCILFYFRAMSGATATLARTAGP